MANERLNRLKSGAVAETKKLVSVFLYLWVFLTVLSLHKAFIFNENILTYQQGFALINAIALAKIVVIAQDLHIGERLELRSPPFNLHNLVQGGCLRGSSYCLSCNRRNAHRNVAWKNGS